MHALTKGIARCIESIVSHLHVFIIDGDKLEKTHTVLCIMYLNY